MSAEFSIGDFVLLRAFLAEARAARRSTGQAVNDFANRSGGRFAKVKVWSIVKANDLGWRKGRRGADPNAITLDEAILIFRKKELEEAVRRSIIYKARRAERERRLKHCRKLNEKGKL